MCADSCTATREIAWRMVAVLGSTVERWEVRAGAVAAPRSAVMSRGARAGVKELVGSCDFRHRCGGPVRVPAVHVWFQGSQSSSCSSPVAECVWSSPSLVVSCGRFDLGSDGKACCTLEVSTDLAPEDACSRIFTAPNSSDDGKCRYSTDGAMDDPGKDHSQYDLSVVPV